jgi:thymidylate synthase ThyX
MSGIEVRVIADSENLWGQRLVTFHVKFHRFILAEVNTHRVFSRNYRSSRAVPSKKLIDEVRANPARPVAMEANKPGMQGGDPLDQERSTAAFMMWQEAAMTAANFAAELDRLGVHKAWVNRVIEPYLFVYGIISSTQWANFFALRRHPDAQPEFKVLADQMAIKMNESRPRTLLAGQWHLPFIQDDEQRLFIDYAVEHHMDYLDVVRRVSAARCARTSYRDFDGSVAPISKDMELYDKLVVRDSVHASPLEHQATPDSMVDGQWLTPILHGNFRGWNQFRRMIPNHEVND